MERAPDPDPTVEIKPLPGLARQLRPSDYFWRPWYAKVWWIAIPLYWLPMGTAWGALLEKFYMSGIGIVTNIIFLPVTAGLILGFRYLRRIFADAEAPVSWQDYDVWFQRPGAPPPWADESNPRSGAQWIVDQLGEKSVH